MASRGRKPKIQPAPAGELPQKPDWLDQVAAAKWDELVEVLGPKRILTCGDGDRLAAYCVAWSNYLAATRALKRGQEKTNRRSGVAKTVPAFERQRTAEKQLRELGALFGLDPLSRGRVKAPASEASLAGKGRFFNIVG